MRHFTLVLTASNLTKVYPIIQLELDIAILAAMYTPLGFLLELRYSVER